MFGWASPRGGRKGKDREGLEEPQTPSTCTTPGKDLMGFENCSIILCGSSIVLMCSLGTCDHHAHCADGEMEAPKGQGAWCLPSPISGARSKPEMAQPWRHQWRPCSDCKVTGISCWLRAESRSAWKQQGDSRRGAAEGSGREESRVGERAQGMGGCVATTRV